jgi:hypothetical protein
VQKIIRVDRRRHRLVCALLEFVVFGVYLADGILHARVTLTKNERTRQVFMGCVLLSL